MEAKTKINDLFVNVFNLINNIEEKRLKEFAPDLSISEIHVLDCIKRINEPAMTNIADTLHITGGSLTIAINGLVRKGYVKRSGDKNDRRKVLLELTPNSEDILTYHNLFHEKMIDAVLAECNKEESEILAIVLKKLGKHFLNQINK